MGFTDPSTLARLAATRQQLSNGSYDWSGSGFQSLQDAISYFNQDAGGRTNAGYYTPQVNVNQAAATAPTPAMAQPVHASNNNIISNNQGIAQNLINQYAQMPQNAARTQQFAPNPYLQQGNAPTLPQGQQQGMAKGGLPELRRTHGFHVPGGHGLVVSPTGGRADKVSTSVQPDSFIIPADVVSGIGQGNSLAGANFLNQALKMGPYGITPSSSAKGGLGPPKAPGVYGMDVKNSMRQANKQSPIPKAVVGNHMPFKDGGSIPVSLSGGEFHIPPDKVLEIGNGDMKEGHRTLKKFVEMSRARHIRTLKSLPPPKS